MTRLVEFLDDGQDFVTFDDRRIDLWLLDDLIELIDEKRVPAFPFLRREHTLWLQSRGPRGIVVLGSLAQPSIPKLFRLSWMP